MHKGEHTGMQAWMHSCTRISTNTCTLAHRHAQVYASGACVHAYTHPHMHTCIQAHMCARLHAHKRACAHASLMGGAVFHAYTHAYLRLCQYSPYRWYAQSEGKYISYACPLLSSYSRTLKMSELAFENPFKRHPTLSIWRYRWQHSMGTRVSACLYIDTHTRLIVL
jgi:hypothetical protein